MHRELVVVESAPGVVTVTPELLGDMLRKAGVVEGSRPELLVSMSREDFDALAREAGA